MSLHGLDGRVRFNLPDRRADVQAHRTIIADAVQRAMERLTDLEAQVITRLYGFNGFRASTQEQVAAELGFTRQRVSQIKKSAEEKIRQTLEYRP